MAWIESHQAVGQHPKTIQLAERLHVSLPCAVGHLHYLWWWALDFAQDGRIKRVSAAVIAKACLWRGDPERFWQGLVESGFVDATADGACIHDWDEYAGRLIDKRRLDAERKRAGRAAAVQRTSNGRLADVRRTVPNQPDQPNRTVPTQPPNPPSDPPNGGDVSRGPTERLSCCRGLRYADGSELHLPNCDPSQSSNGVLSTDLRTP